MRLELGQILADFEGAAFDAAGVQLRENLDDFHGRVVLLFFNHGLHRWARIFFWGWVLDGRVRCAGICVYLRNLWFCFFNHGWARILLEVFSGDSFDA